MEPITPISHFTPFNYLPLSLQPPASLLNQSPIRPFFHTFNQHPIVEPPISALDDKYMPSTDFIPLSNS